MDNIRDRHPQLNHTAEHQELVTIRHIQYLWETEACCIHIVAPPRQGRELAVSFGPAIHLRA